MMRTQTIFIFIAVLSLFGSCKSEGESSESKGTTGNNQVQKEQFSADTIYAANAFKILSFGEVLEGRKEIIKYKHKEEKSPISENQLFETRSHPKNNVYYEIQELSYSNDQKVKRLIVWRDLDSCRVKEFEYEDVTPRNHTSFDTAIITKRRETWMELCNNHQIIELINNLYTENTIYFNHKPLVIGRQGLIEEYSYMNRPSYNLKLNPLIVEIVNDSTIYEIGQCSGSYKGKYVLVWKMDPDGLWRIFIDANV